MDQKPRIRGSNRCFPLLAGGKKGRCEMRLPGDLRVCVWEEGREGGHQRASQEEGTTRGWTRGKVIDETKYKLRGSERK